MTMSEFKWHAMDSEVLTELGTDVILRVIGDYDIEAYRIHRNIANTEGWGDATHWSYIPAPVSELDTLRARVAELEAEKANTLMVKPGGGTIAAPRFRGIKFESCSHCADPHLSTDCPGAL